MALIAVSCIYGLILTVLTLFDNIKQYVIPAIDDPFAVKCLEASSDWVGFEPCVGIVLILCTIAFCILIRRRKTTASAIVLSAGNIFFLLTTMICAVGEVEKYTQASAVDFFISKKGEDCLICPVYYNTYAHYFYSDRKPENAMEDFEILKKEDFGRKCYFVLKDYEEDLALFMSEVPEAQLLYRQSGFAFFVREASQSAKGQPGGDQQNGKIE